MYAQVIELRPAPERLGVVERLVRSELLPALRAEAGFSGALHLTDPERAGSLLVLLWETEDQAARPLAHAPVTERLSSNSLSMTVWEVDARA